MIDLYSNISGLVFGFHGCNKTIHDKVLIEHEHLTSSSNDYDWLGNGIYFWENSYQRALNWATAKYKENAAVVGAIIDLGYCLNLTDYKSNEILKNGYEILKASRLELPKNSGNRDGITICRHLDCAVIETIHSYLKAKENRTFDSVRGVFTEGKPVYEGSGILEKTHIQICVVNTECIKGYFEPILSKR